MRYPDRSINRGHFPLTLQGRVIRGMDVHNLDDFWGGWFVGAFYPSLGNSPHFEVAVKRFSAGEREPKHYQVEATEITVIVSGHCRIGDNQLGPNEIIRIAPLETADFEALTDVVLVAVKFPSLANDKRLTEPE